MYSGITTKSDHPSYPLHAIIGADLREPAAPHGACAAAPGRKTGGEGMRSLLATNPRRLSGSDVIEGRWLRGWVVARVGAKLLHIAPSHPLRSLGIRFALPSLPSPPAGKGAERSPLRNAPSVSSSIPARDFAKRAETPGATELCLETLQAQFKHIQSR